MNRRNALKLLGAALLAPAGYRILLAAPDEATAKATLEEVVKDQYLDGITESTYPLWEPGYRFAEPLTAGDLGRYQREINEAVSESLDRKTPLMRLFWRVS